MKIIQIQTFKDIRLIGRQLGFGLLEALAPIFAACLVLSFLNPPDSTDRGWFRRSGLTPLTDEATGVQYLRCGSALTPRLDSDGKPIIAKP